jgi:hypothetical protein
MKPMATIVLKVLVHEVKFLVASGGNINGKLGKWLLDRRSN